MSEAYLSRKSPVKDVQIKDVFFDVPENKARWTMMRPRALRGMDRIGLI